ncbi:ribonuclease H-like domain-containing protein [Tanacetum coccineum]|uniref:Ribonuclease H-like domain-containing protein n=1 Tax=Tanacetum coccineum TaxID=301880 RepID=A0ABQ5EP49_9ASTR
MKARGILLMALPNKDQLKFHSYKDAKLLMEAIEKRYEGNKESKKVQRTLLKLQYKNFAGSSSKTMDQTFDRLQKLISKLEIQVERNKEEIETISLDDLYNNLKIYEPELTGSSSTSQNPQNVAFMSSNSTNSNSSTNEVDTTAYEVSAAHTKSNPINPTSGNNLSDDVICAFLASQPNSPQLAREDLEQIDPGNLEEMYLQWEMAMLTIRARRFIKRTGRKLDVNGQRVGFDRSKVESYNCHKNSHFTRECRALRNQENKGRENSRRTMTVETLTENALVAQNRIGGYDWSYQAEEEHPTNYALMEYTSSGSSSSLDSEIDSCSKSCLESVKARLAHYKKNEAVFEESINVLNLEVKLRDNALVENKKNRKRELHAVPPPYIGNFIPSKPDLMFMDEIVESENIDVITVVTPSNVKKVESNHESADVKNNGDAVEPKTVRKNSFRTPVIEDWNFDDDSEVEFIPNVEDKTVRPSTKKIKFVKSVRETVEKVETPKQNKHYPRCNQRNWNNLMSQRLGSDFKMINKVCFICGSFEHLHYVCDKKVIRLVWNNSSRVNHKNFANKMTHLHHNRRFVPQAVLTRASHSGRSTRKKGVFDSGCSRHMTRNKFYLTEYEDYDGGFVSFGDGKGRISRKGKIKSRTLVFDDLSSDFKLLDESQVLLRVPRKDNIYSVDLKSVVPTKGITCLFAKNGVAERRNRTLIEDARTMLVDFKLPTTFWAEAVNTACYVINRVLVIKPHTKTPYELILRRTPLTDFMKPFKCLVTILNTKDHLGKFDGKVDEGVFCWVLYWLFDVDSLTISMNYVPDIAGNQTNGIAGKRDNIVAGPKDSEEDVGMKPTEVNESGAYDKGEENEQDTRKADLNNLETTMNISPIPTTRIDKDHPKDQIIGDLNLAIQTRRMTKISDEHDMVSYINKQRRTNNKDYRNCLFACFLSQKEPKKVIQALEDPSWIEAMQEELLQFELQKVWTLVDLPNGKRAIGTK